MSKLFHPSYSLWEERRESGVGKESVKEERIESVMDGYEKNENVGGEYKVEKSKGTIIDNREI